MVMNALQYHDVVVLPFCMTLLRARARRAAAAAPRGGAAQPAARGHLRAGTHREARAGRRYAEGLLLRLRLLPASVHWPELCDLRALQALRDNLHAAQQGKAKATTEARKGATRVHTKRTTISAPGALDARECCLTQEHDVAMAAADVATGRSRRHRVDTARAAHGMRLTGPCALVWGGGARRRRAGEEGEGEENTMRTWGSTAMRTWGSTAMPCVLTGPGLR